MTVRMPVLEVGKKIGGNVQKNSEMPEGGFRNACSMRKLPRQVDSPEVEASWLNTLGLNTAGGTLPRESCGRYSS